MKKIASFILMLLSVKSVCATEWWDDNGKSYPFMSFMVNLGLPTMIPEKAPDDAGEDKKADVEAILMPNCDIPESGPDVKSHGEDRE